MTSARACERFESASSSGVMFGDGNERADAGFGRPQAVTSVLCFYGSDSISDEGAGVAAKPVGYHHLRVKGGAIGATVVLLSAVVRPMVMVIEF